MPPAICQTHFYIVNELLESYLYMILGSEMYLGMYIVMTFIWISDKTL